ncbi:MAG: hypothetical protein SF066_06455 [Thermoanaerobaculia bacterium]|nr:hypothetical protein [Thermoanaerobaculia bacterium]
MTKPDFGALVVEELAPPFLAAGFRSLAEDERSHFLTSPSGEVLRLTLEPRDGVAVDYLVPGEGGGWRSYEMGLYLVKRADKARIPRTRLPGGPLNEERIRRELNFFRSLFEAVGQDLLAPGHEWLSDYPWPSTPLSGTSELGLARVLGRSQPNPGS